MSDVSEDSNEDSTLDSIERSYMDIMSSSKELSWVRGVGAGKDWLRSDPESGEDVWDTEELDMFMGGSGWLGLRVGTGF